MPGPSLQVVIDCADPATLAPFWAELLGYQVQPPPPGFDSWQGFLRKQGVPEDQWNAASAIVDPDGARPRIFFQRVPESKTGKNRVHLDVNAGGPHGTPPEEHAVALGATTLYEMDRPDMGDAWVTMADPEGNEFCIQ